MRARKFFYRLIGLLLGTVVLSLSACSDKNGTLTRWIASSTQWVSPSSSLPTLSTPTEAQQWLNAQAEYAQALSNNTTNLNNQIQTSDRRLVRTVQSVPDRVFMAINTDAPTSTNAASTPENTAPSESVLYDRAPSAFDTRTSPQSPQTELELTQANTQQIKYLGMMQVGSEQTGLVKVGERVYRIAAQDKIGRGQWRVIALDSAHMQLLVNGKVITYDK